MTDTQTHRHTDTQTESGHPYGGGRREWSILIPKLLAIARSLDKNLSKKCPKVVKKWSKNKRLYWRHKIEAKSAKKLKKKTEKRTRKTENGL
jgi:hypothetical protein